MKAVFVFEAFDADKARGTVNDLLKAVATICKKHEVSLHEAHFSDEITLA